MANTTFSGPIRAGTIRHNAAANIGSVVLTQTDTFTFADTGTTATGIILPANSQIIDMHVDMFTAFDSATSDAMEIGDGTDADAYGDVTNLQQTGRLITTLDGDQIAAIDAIGTSDVTINITINSAGGGLSAGSGRLTVLYRQN
ncbi:MAG: hypothetical protein ACYTHJ_21460 [Planctomycetota bacterium]|jgi:hypothetical protein